MNAIKAKELVVQKGKANILHGLDMTIRAGTITGLIGPSGSGKTTLMRAIVGVQKYSGELLVLGKPAGAVSLRPRLGYVTQSPAVYDDLTVKQNIHYFARVVGVAKHDADAVLAQVRLDAQQGQLVRSLSGGQRARVSLAIALLGDPDILILDEPTVGLDPILRNELWSQFSELARQGKTLLVSSHVMDEAERCEELVLIRDGNLLWNDSRQKLMEVTKASSVSDAFVSMIKREV
jgi:ABC-2 type transport system ATP-binding protein